MNRVIIGLGVGFLLAAVFAVLWYGAYVENGLLRKQVEDLNKQLEVKSAELQRTTQQLVNIQSQLIDAQTQLSQTRRQLAELERQLIDAQTQLSQTRRQLAELERRRAELLAQLEQLNATYQRLRSKVYAGRDLVQQAKALLGRITLKAPRVDDTWTFIRTYNYAYRPLRSGYFYPLELSLYSYQTVEVQTSELLYIAFFTPDQYERWHRGYDGTPLTQGRGYVKFTPPRNETYVLVIYNDLGRDVGEFQVTIRYLETWRYYDVAPLRPTGPYVVGSLGTPSRDFFRLFAIYNYWLENRHKLAEEVRRQLGDVRGDVRAFSPQLQLDTQILYALSLAALLKDAGFDVSFSAIGVSLKDPFEPSSIIPQVRFYSTINPNATFNRMFQQIPKGWMSVTWTSREAPVGYEFYVIINTYNVVEVVDRWLDTITPFNIIYSDGVTLLP